MQIIIRTNGRKERNHINYRCNYRLKYGKNKCDNDNMVEETFLLQMIEHQLSIIDMNIENVDIKSIIDKIIVSNTRVEIFFKNLPIQSCYYDSKSGILQYDSQNN